MFWFLILSFQGVSDQSIGLESAQNYVEEPENQEEHRTDPLGHLGPSELSISKQGEEPSGQDGGHGEDGADTVDHHTEGQGAGRDREASRCTEDFVVNCGNHPWDSKA